jgi:predicted phage terminase large subunit-like protein
MSKKAVKAEPTLKTPDPLPVPPVKDASDSGERGQGVMSEPREAGGEPTQKETGARKKSPPSFSEFAKAAFPTLEARSFHENYYRLLEAFALGRVRRLIVTMPPQHGKSHGSSVLLPAYILGLDPDRRIAIASYSALLAQRFNRRVQRLIESREYAAMFPETTIKKNGAGGGASRAGTKGGSKSGATGGAENTGKGADAGSYIRTADVGSYIRTADHFEVIGAEGELFSVGREGSLTGNRVDTFILDDLYKDAMEANSPIVRDNCWEWYTSVVRTRMHNDSSEIIVFTRWHEEDLIGKIAEREEVVALTSWAQLEKWKPDVWLHLNLEALKASPKTELDPRREGQSLWEERHSKKLLLRKRALDPVQFECMYQGRPSPSEGLLYGEGLRTYDLPPRDVIRRANYTDTADMGDDYLCSVSYMVGLDGLIYVTDVVFSSEPMEVTEGLVAEMLVRSGVSVAVIESNNGGRGFARAVRKLVPDVKVEWFHQSGNKEARILSNSATVLHRVRMPRDWAVRWPAFAHNVATYRRLYHANRWHDAVDVLTGVVEKEETTARKNIKAVR